ncbi:MAG: methionine adenosyltransferase domain-containing protein [Elusimicrobia bacterium]|nr:methionine adenosyltransferase domain-containing protein [Elusimicrobiota bacterium]
MIRVSEMVLPGHPDKFCDQVADAIVAACHAIDEDAYCQVEASVWSDQVFLTGGLVTRRPLERPLRDIVVETGLAIGYTADNHIDARRYKVTDAVCQRVGDPTPWSRKVNDQAIVIGYAGYDRLTHYLPPEHFIAHVFREALTRSCEDGLLRGQGPDGKVLVRMRENPRDWMLEQVLVTLQQRRDDQFVDVCAGIEATLRSAYRALQRVDSRWEKEWGRVDLLLNPNGPLLNGGSDGDNGQTGRKLVMDFYGPRISIGGGALSGKHLSHVDRVAAYAARHAAVNCVASGAKQCLIQLTYAPNSAVPTDVSCQLVGRGRPPEKQLFDHGGPSTEYAPRWIQASLGRGEHFVQMFLPWNQARR